MRINPNISADSAAAGLLNGRATSTSSAPSSPNSPSTPTSSELDPEVGWMRGMSSSGQLDGGPEIQDSTGADQAADFLRSNLISQPGLAFAAQTNQNPEAVFNLLR